MFPYARSLIVPHSIVNGGSVVSSDNHREGLHCQAAAGKEKEYLT